MTEQPTARTRNVRAGDLAGLDLWPVCPRCFELCEPEAAVCSTCGARLLEYETWRRLVAAESSS